MTKRKIRVTQILSGQQSLPTNIDRNNAKAVAMFLTAALEQNTQVTIVSGAISAVVPKAAMIALRDAAIEVRDGYIPVVLRTGRITSSDVAKLLNCSSKHVYMLSNTGILPCVKLPSGHRRYNLEDINAYLSGKR